MINEDCKNHKEITITAKSPALDAGFNGTPKFGEAPIKVPGGYYYDDPEDDPDSPLYRQPED